MTKLGKLNFYLVQWLFVRVARIVIDDNTIGWCLIGPVLPMTGWRTDYIGRAKPIICFLDFEEKI